MIRPILASLFIVPFFSTPSGATVLEVDFTGVVTFLSPPIAPPSYGASIPQFSVVSGHFDYDTNSALVNGTGGSDTISEYRENIPQGLFATFGGIPVSADKYAVFVKDNVPQLDGTVADIIQIQYASNLNPSLNSPLVFNGANQATGMFSINLSGKGSLFSNSVLPSSLAFSDFNVSPPSFLSHAPGPLDVLFVLTSLRMVPEPGTGLLIGIGFVILFQFRLRSRLWRK